MSRKPGDTLRGPQKPSQSATEASKRGRSRRTKGASGEREVAAIFRAAGFDCDRVPNSGGLRLKGDLYGNLPVHVECKRQERVNIWQWLKQAEDEAPEGQTPVVVFRRSRSKWYAALPFDALIELLKENQ